MGKNNLKIYAEDFDAEDEESEAFLMDWLGGEYVPPSYPKLPKGYKFQRHQGYWDERERKLDNAKKRHK
jgi:hypothetical protein